LKNRFESRNGRHRNWFKDFEANGFHKKILTELKRARNKFYQGLASVNGKDFVSNTRYLLERFHQSRCENILASTADVMRVTIHTSKKTICCQRVLFQRNKPDLWSPPAKLLLKKNIEGKEDH
jgi:hypothetical protein